MISQKALLLAALCTLYISTSQANSEKKASQWRTDKEGWVIRKAPGEKHFKKFFAVGLWNVPGFTKCAMEEDTRLYRKVIQPYWERTKAYNMVYLPPGEDINPGGRVEITGSVGFYEALKDYQAHLKGFSTGKDRDYQTRHFIEKNAQSTDFINMLDRSIDQQIKDGKGADHIWAPIDEIVNGGAGSGWCWSPRVGEAIKKQIKKREPHTLVYTDLVGISRGNSYLFEKRYLRTHSCMPTTPPYEALGAGAKVMPERPLLGFVQAYDGSAIYTDGTADYKEYDLPTLKRFFYENLKICSRDYRNCGDVLGINSFIDCNLHPTLAGVAVDGIKAGAGKSTPVWIFFDGNGYAQPSGQDAKAFVNNLKCQMYTSIIHGATGVMFWNDRSLSPEVFNELEPIVLEIEERIPLWVCQTIEAQWDDNVHYMVKQNGQKQTIIATNTSLSPATLQYKHLNRTLQPYETLVMDLPQ